MFSYLDDLCLAGDQTAVAQAVSDLTSAAALVGLKLNAVKCEIIPTAGPHSTVNRSLFPDEFAFKADGNFELLGGPAGSADFCNQHTQERVDKATKLLSAWGSFLTHRSLYSLLRHKPRRGEHDLC